MEILKYRITGPQSIDRLHPLLQQLGNKLNYNFQFINNVNELFYDGIDQSTTLEERKMLNLYFVWETFCEKEWKNYHSNALLLNRLSNSMIFEDKGNFAFLSLRMEGKTLETYIAVNRSSLLNWCEKKWENTISSQQIENTDRETLDLSFLASQSFLNEPFEWSLTAETSHSRDWWAIKATRGNGGKDVWIIHRENFQTIIPTLPSEEEYISNPLLWNHKKFHFRCYGVVFGDLSGLLFEKCYILSASRDYENLDLAVNNTLHLTNLSINKKYPGHPGQVPCWLSRECPPFFAQISAIWSDLITAASPFMGQQLSSTHYEFVGLDILCDSFGDCHLLEVNRVPGLESSNNRCKPQEEEMYDEMMLSFIEILIEKRRILDNKDDQTHLPFGPSLDSSNWQCVRERSQDPSTSSIPVKTYENLFNWKAFTKKNRSKIVV